MISYFKSLMDASALVKRLRVFNCTFGDEVCDKIGEWLGAAGVGEVPSELHLSDCSMTTEGFQAIMQGIESNENIPQKNEDGENMPMYIRVERNYIENPAIQEKVDEGTIILIGKQAKAREHDGQTAKVKLLVMDDWNLRQP